MATTQELRDKRAAAWAKMQEIMSRNGGDLTAEDSAEYDRAEVDCDNIERDLKRQEGHEARAKIMATVDRSDLVPSGKPDAAEDKGAQYARAFGAMLRAGRGGINELEVEDRSALTAGFVDQRALGGSVTTAGGYTVPPDFRAKIIEVMKTFGGMLQVSEVIHTSTGANLQWPTNDDTANVGAILAENTVMSEQDVVLGTNSIDAYMYYSKLVRVSLQLVQDSAFDIESWLEGKLGERVGRILNTHFTTGTGTSQPDGIVTNATVGKTGLTGQVTTIIYDDLIDLIDSLDPAYAANAQFMLSQAGRKVLRKLKDSTGQPLWQPSVQAGIPDQLLGFGYVINQDMPVPAASAKSVLFGDFKQAYLIRLVTDLSLIRFNERYMDYLQVAFALYQRADGTLQNTSAVRAYAHPAT